MEEQFAKGKAKLRESVKAQKRNDFVYKKFPDPENKAGSYSCPENWEAVTQMVKMSERSTSVEVFFFF